MKIRRAMGLVWLAGSTAGVAAVQTPSPSYVASRRTRSEEWFKFPVGHIEVCNAPVPVR